MGREEKSVQGRRRRLGETVFMIQLEIWARNSRGDPAGRSLVKRRQDTLAATPHALGIKREPAHKLWKGYCRRNIKR